MADLDSIDADEQARLRELTQELRTAIHTALQVGLVQLAVALDTARDAVDSALCEPTTSSRRAMARARAEIALEAWRASAAAHR